MFPNVQQLAAVLLSQDAPARAGGCAESPILLPVIMIAILYVVWILPSQKERKKHGEMLEALKRGDEVVTTSGILGTITDITDKIFTIEIAKNVKIRVLKTSVAKRTDPAADAVAKPDDKVTIEKKGDGAKAPKA